MTLPQSHRNVVVIGGGLAGITAALELAEAGLRVTVLEARPWLGGATFSFARRGLTIDNGQHMFLRCCTAYRELLTKLNVASLAPVQEALELTVIGPDGQLQLRRSGLPAPLHLARSLAGYRLLSVPERMKAAAAMMALEFTDVEAGAGSFDDWLARRFQDGPARRLFWDLLSTSALNAAAGQADSALAASAIRTALLASRDGADLGLPAVPLSRLHGAAAGDLLGRHGAVVWLGVSAVSVQADPSGGYDIRLGPAAQPAGGEPSGRGPVQLKTDGVVLAVPAWEAAELAPAELAAEAARWARLEPAPVVSLHVMYSSRVTRVPFAAIVGPPVLWVVDKTASAGLHTGQYLAVSVPAADDYVDASSAGLREQFLATLARHFPAAANAEVADFFVTRERRATIRQLPGTAALRAGQPAGLAGLALAGAWTDTGWPDTMEGAVRSGHSAAAKILADLLTSAAVTGAVPPRAGSRRGRVPQDRGLQDRVPADRVPADRVPADRVPADRVPADRVPADRVPADRVPADRVPADRVPADRVPPDRVPPDRGPADPLRPDTAPAGLPARSTVRP